MSHLRKQLPLILAALTLFVMLAPSIEAGDRVVFRVNERFEVNGKLFPPGTVVLRALTSYTPVATLNEIRVGGDSLGLLMAHEVANEPAATADELVFRRAADGHLVLVAHAVRGEPIREFYGYRTVSHGGEWFSPSARAGTDAESLVSDFR